MRWLLLSIALSVARLILLRRNSAAEVAAAHDNFVRGSFVRGSKGEARAHNGKIEQSQARDQKKGGMSGATLGLVLARDFT